MMLSVTTCAQWLCTQPLKILLAIPQMSQQVLVLEEPPPILQATPPTQHSKIMAQSWCSGAEDL